MTAHRHIHAQGSRPVLHFPCAAERRAMSAALSGTVDTATLDRSEGARSPLHSSITDGGKKVNAVAPGNSLPSRVTERAGATVQLAVHDEDRPAAPLLPGTQAGGSIQRVLRERLNMIENGHTVETDLQNHRGFLVHRAQHHVTQALKFVKSPALDRNRTAYLAQLTRIAAYTLAEMDRTAAELAATQNTL